MMLYISAMDHTWNLKFSSYVHLSSINKIFQYRYASHVEKDIMIKVGEVYISVLEH